MRTGVTNKTCHFCFNGNLSQGEFSGLPRGLVVAVHDNGSMATAHPSQTAPPLDRGSGIIPGGIAAAVFIGFLLMLYAMLWKCMGTPPRKKENKVKMREQRELLC